MTYFSCILWSLAAHGYAGATNETMEGHYLILRYLRPDGNGSSHE